MSCRAPFPAPEACTPETVAVVHEATASPPTTTGTPTPAGQITVYMWLVVAPGIGLSGTLTQENSEDGSTWTPTANSITVTDDAILFTDVLNTDTSTGSTRCRANYSGAATLVACGIAVSGAQCTPE